MSVYVPQTDFTAQSFADLANENHLPWDHGHQWSDSMIEQYFSMLNAEQANQHEIEMWRLNNEYNTPRSQMQRLVEAGINPAAAYQQITPGTASAPSTHEAKTPAWHDTSDRLNQINTILSGISQIMGTLHTGIESAQDVQDIALTHQNNWINKSRAKLQGLPTYDESAVKELGGELGFIELSPGKYALDSDLVLFPEMIKAYGLENNQRLQYLARTDQHSLVERRNRIDGIMQKIIHGFEHGSSSQEMLKLFLELFAYGLQQRVGGGF